MYVLLYTERSGKTSGVVAQTYKEENIIIQNKKNRTVLKTHLIWVNSFCVIIVFSHARMNEFDDY